MAIHFVTYSADNMTRSREVCVQAGKENGADITYSFNIQNNIDISYEFFLNNSETIKSTRGFGYWLQKPYLINKVVLDCKDGDILVYCDAGVKIINNLNNIINVMDQDIFLFSNGHQHVHWCKMDVIRAINTKTDDERKISNPSFIPQFNGVSSDYCDLQQAQASVIFFKVNQNTRNFIKEWLLWSQMPGFIDDSPSKLPNYPEFAQHRYDQAILTCMSIKYEYKLHYWADQRWYWSQRSRWPGDDYPLMFDHHRYANKGMGGGDRPEWP